MRLLRLVNRLCIRTVFVPGESIEAEARSGQVVHEARVQAGQFWMHFVST